jgi:hypothetical protein
LAKKQQLKSALKPNAVDSEFTIFDALVESMQKKELHQSKTDRVINFLSSPMNLTALALMVAGSATLVWIGSIICCDLTFWGKDLALTLFGSRTGETISLDIGMTAISYVILAAVLLGSSALLLLKNRRIRVL